MKGKEIGVWIQNRGQFDENQSGTAELWRNIERFLQNHIKQISEVRESVSKFLLQHIEIIHSNSLSKLENSRNR